MFKKLTILVAFAIANLVTHSAHAQNVAAQISTREAYVGQPVLLQIQVANAEKFDAPELPVIDGLEIESVGTPARTNRLSIVNGRRSQSTSITYQYQITPRVEGEFTIPSIDIQINGKKQSTETFEIVVSKSETGDLMFVEVTGEDDQVYVGQPIKLTLKIWLRPYADREFNLKLNELNMWQLISRNTNWGSFQDRMDQLDAENKRPGGKEVLRVDGSGNKHAYYLYEIDAMVYPQRPGQIDVGDVQIVANYPTKLAKSRSRFSSAFDDDFFGGGMDDFFADSPFSRDRLAVKSARPIAGEATLPPIKVINIPTVGRPADYRGAVGKYRISTAAQPTNVSAGDPVTLQIVLQGDGPMELVQAPPIAAIDSLTENFKVADDNLAGYVQNDAKLFSTSIRPRRAGITEIPPIPFSFFNPETSSFETVTSQPIPISVEKADSLSLDAIIGNTRGSKQTNDSNNEPTESVTTPILTNFTASEIVAATEILQGRGARNNWATLPVALGISFLIPPMLFGCCWLLLPHNENLIRPNRLVGWLKTLGRSRNQFVAVIPKVRHANSAAEIAQLLESAFTATKQSQASEMIARCNESAYSPGAGESLTQLKSGAIEILRSASDQGKRFTTSNMERLMIAIAVGLTSMVSNPATSFAQKAVAGNLTLDQQTTILKEANELYRQAVTIKDGDHADIAESKDALQLAIQKYHTVADSGLASPKLFFNLGNAHLQVGELGRAIGNFERAHRLAPHDQSITNNLEFARTKLKGQSTDQSSVGAEIGWSAFAGEAIKLNNRIPAYTVWWIAWVAWALFWVVAFLRFVYRPQSDDRTSLVSAAVSPFNWLGNPALLIPLTVFLVAAGSILISQTAHQQFDGVAVSEVTELRQADGESFPVVGQVDMGQHLQLIDQRGDWLKVQTVDSGIASESNSTGWVPRDQVYLFGS